jgi:hypothetical protein
MRWAFVAPAWAISFLSSLLLAGAVAAQQLPSAAQQPAPATAGRGAIGRLFEAGLVQLGLVFKGIGSLAGGPAAGAIWRVDLRSGEGRPIGVTADLAWPVPSPDGSAVYALRGRQVVRIMITNGQETALGAPADWRKLIGVLSDGTLLGFIDDDPRPRPALLAPDGRRSELPPPANDAERARNGALLQEGRDYADGTRLEVRDSERGGRGRDVFLVGGARSGNLTDCGDDLCGQPSRSLDGLDMFYIRRPRR